MTTPSTDSSDLPPFLIALRTTFIACLGLLIVSGNILSIAVTQQVPNLADSTKVLMTTLAVYDLLFGVAILPTSIASALDKWPFGTFGCAISASCNNTAFCMTIASIILLNVERYIAITRPYKFPMWCTRRRVIVLVLLLSILAISFSVIVQFVGISAQYFAATALCFYEQRNFQIVSTVAAIFLNIVPTIVMTCIYYRLIKISQEHQLRNNQNGQNEANNIQDNKALKTFLVVTLTFAVCYSPVLIMGMVEAFTGATGPDWFQFVAVWLAGCNSAFNVFIYCLFNQSYRQIARKLISSRFPRCKNPVAPVNM